MGKSNLYQSLGQVSVGEAFQASILATLKAGVSTGKIKNVLPDPQETSKSNVSRHWQQVGHKLVKQLRGQDLSEFDGAVLMLDGICLSKNSLATSTCLNTSHRNLLSTNAIENSFRNTRRKLGRVTRFRAVTDQATRWLAFALAREREHERGDNPSDPPGVSTSNRTSPDFNR